MLGGWVPGADPGVLPLEHGSLFQRIGQPIWGSVGVMAGLNRTRHPQSRASLRDPRCCHLRCTC